MLVTPHSDKRRKNATYGKSIRRQGPAHLIDFGDTKVELPVRPVSGKNADGLTSSAIKRPSPSIPTDVYDLPSSSEDQTPSSEGVKRRKLLQKSNRPAPEAARILSPSPADIYAVPTDSEEEPPSSEGVKRRKLAKKSTRPAPKLEPTMRPRKTSPRIDSEAKTATRPPSQKAQPRPNSKPAMREEAQSIMHPPPAKSRTRPTTKLARAPETTVRLSSTEGDVARKGPPEISKQFATSNSTKNSRHTESMVKKTAIVSDARSTSPEFTQPVSVEASLPEERITSTPAATYPRSPSELGAESGSSTRQRSNTPVLTPRSEKTWKVLLGEDDEVVRRISPPTAGRRRIEPESKPAKPVRRRLIDTLVQQRKSTSDSESIQSSQESEAAMKPSSRVTSEPDQAESTSFSTPLIPSSNDKQPLPATGGPRITYSRQRSMLAEQDDLMRGLEMGSQSLESESQRGFAPSMLRNNSSYVDEEMEDSQSAPAIRSVHELRQAGATKRFMDEVEDLSDRITASEVKPSIRRSALLELLGKVQDKTFLRNLLSSGVDQKMLATMSNESDEVSGFLLASVLLVLLDPATTNLSASSLATLGFFAFCRRLLKTTESISFVVKQRKANMSKVAQTAVVDEQQRLLDLPVWGDVLPAKLSPRTVALACLALVLRQRDARVPPHSLIPRGMIDELQAILQSCVKSPIEATSKTLQCDLLLLVSILGGCYLPSVGEDDHPHWGPDYLRCVCSVATELIPIEDGEMATLRGHVLRLTLNITNNNDYAVEIFAVPTFLQNILRAVVVEFGRVAKINSEDERMDAVNSLVLMLGIMINLAEKMEDEQAEMLLGSSLSEVSQIFSGNAEKSFEADSVEDTHFNVAFGYLAVLFGYLSLKTPLVKPIRKALPGGNLKTLIDAVREFIRHHQQVDALSQEDMQSYSANTALTERLSRMLRRISKVEAGLS